jgi:hypothetical protein
MAGICLVLSLALSAPPGISVKQDRARGVPQALFGLDIATTGSTDKQRALDFVSENSDLLGGMMVDQLRFVRISRRGQFRTARFQFQFGNYPIERRFLTIRLDRNNRVRRVHSDFDRWHVPPVKAPISGAGARTRAMVHVDGISAGAATRVVLPGAPGQARHVWRVPVAKVALVLQYIVYLDAQTGAVLTVNPAGKDQLEELR